METATHNIEDLIAEAAARVGANGGSSSALDPFLDVACEILQEHGELDEYRALATEGIRGANLSAFHFEDEENRLDLIAVVGSADGKLGLPDLRRAIQRAIKMLDHVHGWTGDPSNADGVLEFCDVVRHSINRTTRIRLLVISQAEAARGLELDEAPSWQSHEIEVRVWDRASVERMLRSGVDREGIRIDLSAFPSGQDGLVMLHSGVPNLLYETYLTFMPGEMLAEIYRQHGARLLERNVRSFLQVRGKVNKGIRETIRVDPGMFLAYNNGLAATVSGLEGSWEGDIYRATAMIDFRIVNGGQTTASLAKACQDRLALDGISVQVKLAHIKGAEGDREKELVSNIARYANSQNKVRDTDLKSSHEFYQRLEELSRTIWAPRGRNKGLTRWFFERSRGQYLTERGAAGRGARQTAFLKENPRSQVMASSEVAKYEHTWDCRPHDVSRGSQKNFLLFQDSIEERRSKPDAAWFMRLVAKAILFRATDQVVLQQNFGGYKANIATYTLAWIAHRSGRGLDLDAIWKSQECPQELITIIAKASHGVNRLLRDSQGRNITENAKRKETWDRIAQDDLGLGSEDVTFLEEIRNRVANGDTSAPIVELNDEEQKIVQAVMAQPTKIWMDLLMWAKKTDVLQGWQRSILYSVGKRLQTGLPPTVKQARQVLKALEEGRSKGFTN